MPHVEYISYVYSYLPWQCIWSTAASTSSTISTVQAIELYSWWNESAVGISNALLALGPPYIVTPAVNAFKLVNYQPHHDHSLIPSNWAGLNSSRIKLEKSISINRQNLTKIHCIHSRCMGGGAMCVTWLHWGMWVCLSDKNGH